MTQQDPAAGATRHQPPRPGDVAGFRVLAAVFVGGAVGTALRLSLDAAAPHRDDAFPLSTLLINVAGSFALAFLVARVWPFAPAWVRVGLGPGLLGGFTTFSAVTVSLVALTSAGLGVTAVVYLALTVTLGCASAAAGLVLGRRARPDHRPPHERPHA
jgi:CrcB protein